MRWEWSHEVRIATRGGNGHARYEPPSEILHSLIFILLWRGGCGILMVNKIGSQLIDICELFQLDKLEKSGDMWVIGYGKVLVIIIRFCLTAVAI